jgi:hypothetical protein
MWNLFGYGNEAAGVAPAAATPAAAAGAAVAIAAVAFDAQELDENLDALDERAAGDKEKDVAADLRALLNEVRQGAQANKEEFKQMRARLEVLEANTFVEAAKWIFEAICELFCKIEKAIIDMGENFPGFGGKANRAGEFNDLKMDFDKDIKDINKLEAKSRMEGKNDKEYYQILRDSKEEVYKEKQEALHAKHEQQVDAKYGKGRYQAERDAKDGGKVLTAGEKAAFWEQDPNCQYNGSSSTIASHFAL